MIEDIAVNVNAIEELSTITEKNMVRGFSLGCRVEILILLLFENVRVVELCKTCVDKKFEVMR